MIDENEPQKKSEAIIEIYLYLCERGQKSLTEVLEHF